MCPFSAGRLCGTIVSLQFLTCFRNSVAENYCWQPVSPENYNCECECEVIKWSVLNVSLTGVCYTRLN